MSSSQNYSDICGKGVLRATRVRCDRLMFYLRSADGPVTAEQLAEHAMRNRWPDRYYGVAPCLRDLRRLSGVGLVRDLGGAPKLWEARR